MLHAEKRNNYNKFNHSHNLPYYKNCRKMCRAIFLILKAYVYFVLGYKPILTIFCFSVWDSSH